MKNHIRNVASKYLNLPAERIRLKELKEDWIAWEKTDESMAGGLRLVLSKVKNAKPFFISSSETANDIQGVSARYCVVIRELPGLEMKKVSKIVCEYINLSVSETYKLLGAKNLGNQFFYIIVN